MSDDLQDAEIPAEEIAMLRDMVHLSDEELWAAAREQMPADIQARMSVLMTKEQFWHHH